MLFRISILLVIGVNNAAPDADHGFEETQSSGGEFAVRSQTIDSASSDSFGGDFRIRSTLGQGDVGVSTGGEFRVAGGFWVATGPSDFIFSDSFE